MTIVVTVIRPFDDGPAYNEIYTDMVVWAKEKCDSYQSSQSYSSTIRGEYQYDFEFHKERDATLFTLRWT